MFTPLQVEDAEIATEGDYSEDEEDSEDEGDSNNAYNASADDPMDREEAASVAGAIDDADEKVYIYYALELDSILLPISKVLHVLYNCTIYSTNNVRVCP